MDRSKSVYTFGNGKAEGRADLRNLLGGKGANLAEMASIGLPVPPGFTLTTEVCAHYTRTTSYPADLSDQVNKGMAFIERSVGSGFGDPKNPLLVSVRSGARASMPGMMDTILNLGLNDETVEGLARKSGDPRFAYDSYRRFIQMFADVVMGVNHAVFEDILSTYKDDRGLELDTDLKAEDWRAIIAAYKSAVEQSCSTPFPQDPQQQLWQAITAVFQSWTNQRAITYRRLHDIPQSWGTAVNIQAMVFGNMGDDCATGVAFTRNPSTGENLFYGEYLVNAQGEDVVAGIRTPQSLTLRGKAECGSTKPALEEVMPDVFHQLVEIRRILETHYRDMQDIEFTIQSGTLYMLQTRSGKRTTRAAMKIAVDMVHEGLLSEEEAVLRIDPASLDQLLHPTLDPKAAREVIASGLSASPGAATGHVVFSAERAVELAAQDKKVILCRTETSPEDIHGMHAAVGILTTRGGMTSHAAVVARGMGRPCVSGAGALKISYAKSVIQVGESEIREGDMITIDGTSGEVMLGAITMVQPEMTAEFTSLMKWADRIRKLRVRTNADTPDDCRVAVSFGAQGIGLCRTEHMFFDENRILAMREMILAETETDRRKALAKIQPMQKQDFKDIFRIMAGLPVTIRLLDPPLHEFLPHRDEDLEALASASGLDFDKLKARLQDLIEVNPMLGHRGCRLGITYPEIYEMQARAIFEAAVEVQEEGLGVFPEIMIPLVAWRKELEILRSVVEHTANAVLKEKQASLDYMIGTMIELPRAALKADEISEVADFFSFGTNDLTQTTFGLSRDDAGRFIHDYERKSIIEKDPFATLDVDGVGELVRIAVERGRKAKPGLKLGICGEHGGDPASIRFCADLGLDYVSCSPYRVPIARLAAAQATLAAVERDV